MMHHSTESTTWGLHSRGSNISVKEILTLRISLPRGSEGTASVSDTSQTKEKKRLLYARDMRSKSAPPVCSWKGFLGQTVDKKHQHICRFNIKNGNCTHFPCKLPNEYNGLGFAINQNRDEAQDRFKTSNQLSSKARERLIQHLENESVRRPLKSSADQTSKREKALRMFVAEMRLRSEAGRPKDWVTNYGTPVSRRKLFNIPVSAKQVSE